MRLESDIDKLKYELAMAMRKRMPIFDYNMPLIGEGSTLPSDSAQKTLRQKNESELENENEISFGEKNKDKLDTNTKKLAQEIEIGRGTYSKIGKTGQENEQDNAQIREKSGRLSEDEEMMKRSKSELQVVDKTSAKMRELQKKFGRKDAVLMASLFDKHCWNCFGKDLMYPPQGLNPLWIK